MAAQVSALDSLFSLEPKSLTTVRFRIGEGAS